MTAVMTPREPEAYPAVMDARPYHPLSRLLDAQRALEQLTSAPEPTPGEVLELGAQVLEFAEREESALLPALPLLDQAARDELTGEHARLAEDLELLRWLVSTTPESADVTSLAAAIARRMRLHVARDGRLLEQARRLAALKIV